MDPCSGRAEGLLPQAPSLYPSPTAHIILASSAEHAPAKLEVVAQPPATTGAISSPSPSGLQVPALPHHALILGVTSPTGFKYVSSMFLASVAAYSSRCCTSPALPGEPPGARCPNAAHRSSVSGASRAEPAHSRFWENGNRVGSARWQRQQGPGRGGGVRPGAQKDPNRQGGRGWR